MSRADTVGDQPSLVLGQKYAYATASLLLGIASFVNLLSLEKALLAIVFAWLALKSSPAPSLTQRRSWARCGLFLGLLMVVTVPVVLILFAERLHELITALQRLP
jgi:hypothetical protein